MKRKLYKILTILFFLCIIGYVTICILFYFKQDSLLFYPEKLGSEYIFNFKEDFEEHELKTKDGVLLNSLLFKVKEPSGLIFYLHGNGGPFYSIPDLKNNFSNLKFLKIIPSFLFKYKFKNFKHIENGNVPVIIMHGNQDDFIYYGSSVKLSKHFQPGDTLISIKNGDHSIAHENEMVQDELRRILYSN